MILIMKKISIISLYLILFIACRNTPAASLLIEKISTTSQIPSGSGITVSADSAYLVGDDATFIFKMDLSSGEGRKILIDNGNVTGRIPKPVKHDLESCILAAIEEREYLITFGSGGLSPYRDSLVAIPIADEKRIIKISLQVLYDSIASHLGLTRPEINIEGAALMGSRLVLLNRGRNFLVVLPWNEISNYIQSEGRNALPSFSIIPIQLPVVENFPVGFSGACTLPGNRILFTASLEKTSDYISDGEVLAGYVGILEITGDTKAELVRLDTLKNAHGKILPIKIESIDLQDNCEGYPLRAIAVADNDDGKTLIMNIQINEHPR